MKRFIDRATVLELIRETIRDASYDTGPMAELYVKVQELPWKECKEAPDA